MLLGIDTGGTFTDFVLLAEGRLTVHKVLSTPDAPEEAILQGLADMGLLDVAQRGGLVIIHGTTVATNAALERKGVRTAYVTNRGLADVLTLGRQARAALYDLQPAPPQPPVPPELCLETGGRLDPAGNVVEPLTDADLQALGAQVRALAPEAVAINLLYSFVDDRFERAIEAALPEGLFVSRSSAVLPEYREYERGIATWLNAWLGPKVSRYLGRLEQRLAPSPVTIMQSSGGTIAAGQAAKHAVRLLLSGPAGGLAGARHIGRSCGHERLLTFDMGGTSTDVALIDGAIGLTSEGRIGPWPVAVPMVDMHTIGAGGGSIARLDPGGMLQVGPESAGAHPGPACYGSGGTEPTVTDANVVLGRLRPQAFLGGRMRLDPGAARTAVARIAEPMGVSVERAAAGIVELANEHMVRALRVISVQRGHDPAAFTLCSFGGAGGLHVCALADALGMHRALVPVNAGVLSALGMLVAPRERQLSRTISAPLTGADSEIRDVLAELAQTGGAELEAEGVCADAIERAPGLDLRYTGQSWTLHVPWHDSTTAAAADFNELHERRYGHRLDKAIELVNVRLGLTAAAVPPALPEATTAAAGPPPTAAMPDIGDAVAVRERDSLPPERWHDGPLLLTELVATTLVAPHWRVRRDRHGNLHLQRR